MAAATAKAPAVPANPVVEPAGRLKGKVALITGGTRGLGWAIAQAYAREGAKIVIAARTESDLKARNAELTALGVDCGAARVDLADPVQASRLYNAATRLFGKVDILVNNAGILGPRTTVSDYPIDQWRAVMEANLDSTFYVTRGVLGVMIPQNAGTIINVSSGVGRKGRAKWGAYAVAKGAIDTLTEVLADEVAVSNIRVNSVNPGPARTAMRAEAFPGEDPATLMTPEQLVNVFIYLASDASKGVTGQHLEARDFVGRSF